MVHDQGKDYNSSRTVVNIMKARAKMIHEPLLTIAIPTYNGSRTIKNMLDLLLPQCNDKVQLLISDNCSTDSTEEIIADYKKVWTKIEYHRNEVNIGPDANFLQCMRMAKGHFTWLVSDDDIVVEGAVEKITGFLEKHPDMGLVYLTTRDFRGAYHCIDECTIHKPEVKDDLYTVNKSEFMTYAGSYWGFMSSYICNTARFKEISDPEQYYGTYWLQSYIHALCAKGNNAALGVVKGPCVGAGVYINTANFDSALINGIYYKKLIDFMIGSAQFNAKQLNELYIKRLCLLGRHDVIKEKSAGIHNINKKLLFDCTWRFPRAWVTLYPAFLIPGFICKPAMRLYRKRRGIRDEIRINRPE